MEVRHNPLSRTNDHHAADMSPPARCLQANEDTFEILPRVGSAGVFCNDKVAFEGPRPESFGKSTITPDRQAACSPPAKVVSLPLLTRQSLRHWCLAEGLSEGEKKERIQIEGSIHESFHRDATARVKPVLSLAPGDTIVLWGDIFFRNLLHVSCFPDGLSVTGNLNVLNCAELTQISESLAISGSLVVEKCDALRRIGEQIDVSHNLFISECVQLKEISRDLAVGGTLVVQDCKRLTELAGSATIGGDLIVARAENFIALPPRLHIHGSLTCQSCDKFVTAPEGMVVGGDVTFAALVAFSTFGSETAIGHHLDLQGCPHLGVLPEDLRVGGEVNLRGCTRFSYLPFVLSGWGRRGSMRLCVIDLRGTTPSTVMLWRLIQAQCPSWLAVRLDARSRQRVEAIKRARLAVTFSSLEEMLSFWWHTGGGFSLGQMPTHAERDALSERRPILINFLTEVLKTADFRAESRRERLARKVFRLLRQLAQDPGLFAAGCEVMTHGVESCGDRVMVALNDLEVLAWVADAERSAAATASLRELGLRLMRRDLVQQYVRQQYFGTAPLIRTVHELDEIEVMLAFEIGLSERLALPVSAESMLYPATAEVSEASLDDARQSVEQAMADPEQCKRYLGAWGPWQRRERQLEREAWAYATAAGVVWPEDEVCASLRCPISLTLSRDLEEPLMYRAGSTCVVYEAQSLLLWWVEHGTEPSTRRCVTLKSFNRLVKRTMPADFDPLVGS